jgi:hypothetical protein
MTRQRQPNWITQDDAASDHRSRNHHAQRSYNADWHTQGRQQQLGSRTDDTAGFRYHDNSQVNATL